MKKTIAKIMAAAMVLSTIAAPNVLAATVDTTTDAKLTKATAKAFKDVATLKINDKAVLTDGAADVSLDWYLSDTEYSDIANATKKVTKSQTFTTDAVLTTTAAGVDNGNGKYVAPAELNSNNSVTSGTASSVKVSVDVNTVAGIKAILRNDYTAKVSVAKDNVKDLVYASNVPSNYFVTNLTALNTVQNIIDPTVTVGGENMNAWVLTKLASGGAVTVRSNLQIDGADTGLFVYRTLYWNGVSTVTDDYWNAIVKLKASNNRYTPIRVHVDAVSGSLAGLNGLYVQVVNGAATYYYNNAGQRIATTNTGAIAINNWNSNRLQIQDVQPDDLALLRSDAAKGKNLMLDEAYIFNVTDMLNDNGLYSASNWVIDWNILGVNTDLGAVSIGKIQDIRSGLFKKCKEKLVHAENVKWIRNGAFRENKQLKKAVLSDNVSMKKINEKSFYKCKKLNTVKVKVNSLKHVGKNAFGDTTDKKSLKFNLKAGSKAKYNKAVKLFKKSGVKKAKFRKI